MKGERDGRGNDNLLLLSTASIEEDEQHALHHWTALDRCGELSNGRNAESFYRHLARSRLLSSLAPVVISGPPARYHRASSVPKDGRGGRMRYRF